MENLPVHWHEGMFICPHHFQANDRHWHERISQESKWDHPNNYGLKSFSLNQDALANYAVEVTELQARLRDGTLIRIGRHRTLDRLSIAGVFDRVDSAFVFLCVHRQDLSSPSVGNGRDARYSIAELELVDENTGSNDRPIEFRQIYCYLDAKPVDRNQPYSPDVVAPAGVESIPIMRIRSSGKQETKPELDRDYYPPMINTQAWAALENDILSPIYNLVGRNVAVLADRVRNRSLNFSTARAEGDLDDLFKLMVLNRAFAVLKNYGSHIPTHPFDAFVALCALYGDLAVFGEEGAGVEASIPHYRHDELQIIFHWLKIRISKLVHTQEIAWETADFVGQGDIMVAALRQHWFHSDWEWYLGIRIRGSHLHPTIRQDPYEYLLKRRNWKMASKKEIDRVFQDRDVGIEPKKFDGVPHQLSTGWTYYQIEPGGADWRNIKDDCHLALKINRDLVSNRETWSGQRVMELTEDEINLEYRIFAVPKN